MESLLMIIVILMTIMSFGLGAVAYALHDMLKILSEKTGNDNVKRMIN